MSQISNALVRASKLLGRYDQLPEPKGAWTRPVDKRSYALVINFGASVAAVRDLALWAESFGAYVSFESRMVRTVMDIERQEVTGTAHIVSADVVALSRIFGQPYHALGAIEPHVVLQYLLAAGVLNGAKS